MPDSGAAETRRAIEAARAAFPAFGRTTANERPDMLRRMHDVVLERRDELAALLTRERGKPLSEARGEITICAANLQWVAEKARRKYARFGGLGGRARTHARLSVTTSSATMADFADSTGRWQDYTPPEEVWFIRRAGALPAR